MYLVVWSLVTLWHELLFLWGPPVCLFVDILNVNISLQFPMLKIGLETCFCTIDLYGMTLDVGSTLDISFLDISFVYHQSVLALPFN